MDLEDFTHDMRLVLSGNANILSEERTFKTHHTAFEAGVVMLDDGCQCANGPETDEHSERPIAKVAQGSCCRTFHGSRAQHLLIFFH